MTNTRSFLKQIEPGYGMITQTAEERAAALAKQTAEETAPQPTREQLSRAKPPEGMKLNPLYIEKRTKRAQLVLQPSVYEAAKKAAQSRGISLNEYMQQLIIRDTEATE